MAPGIPTTIDELSEQMTAIDLGSAPSGRLHLFGLPTELRDMNFDLVYARTADVQLISRRCWFLREDRKARFGEFDRRQPFPGSKVVEFTVSKAWLVAAARAYARSQPLKVGDYSTHTRGILPAMASEVIGRYSLSCGLRLASVKVLRLRVGLWIFLCREKGGMERPVLQRVVSAQEMIQSSTPSRLHCIGGLNQLELEPDDLGAYNTLRVEYTEEEGRIFGANVKVLEEVLKSRLMQPRSKDHLSAELYPGRSVKFTVPAEENEEYIDPHLQRARLDRAVNALVDISKVDEAEAVRAI